MESIKEVLTTIGQVVMATKIEALADSSNSRKELVLPEIDVSGCGISIFKNFTFLIGRCLGSISKWLPVLE